MTATHRCPGRCGRHLPARLLACTGCTARLPEALSTALAQAFGPHADRAREDARDWLLAHPAPSTLDPADARIAGVCNHCDAPILWLTTEAGKRMPVNAEPDPVRGNVIRQHGIAGVLGASQARAARDGGTRLWLHHVVTCAFADHWHSTSKPARKARR